MAATNVHQPAATAAARGRAATRLAADAAGVAIGAVLALRARYRIRWA
jgi:hypothetical protein